MIQNVQTSRKVETGMAPKQGLRNVPMLDDSRLSCCIYVAFDLAWDVHGVFLHAVLRVWRSV